MKALKNFIVREEGQDLVEYALLAASRASSLTAATVVRSTTDVRVRTPDGSRAREARPRTGGSQGGSTQGSVHPSLMR